MSVHDYMPACLNDYYHNPTSAIGSKGDFTTAPEISQMFGEVLGMWLAYHAQQQNLTQTAHLVECGGGRGTLMADILHAFKSLKHPPTPPPIHLIETNPHFKAMQRTRLATTDSPIHWHDTIDTLPQAPLLLVANEFFDCFPIEQYRFCQNRKTWQLRHVAKDKSKTSPKNSLAFTWCDFTPPKHYPQDKTTTAIHEFAPAHAAIIATISQRIHAHGGAGVVIDYGKETPLGDSLQAVRHHRPIHPLAIYDGIGDTGDINTIKATPADITAWVNFAHLATIAKQNQAYVPPRQTQGDFLTSHGIMVRAEVLAATATAKQRRALNAALDRLVSATHMGQAFKVMTLFPKKPASQPEA